MANAINWLRSKATVKAEASDTFELDGITYVSTWRFFTGKVPFQMARELLSAKLRNSDYENEKVLVNLKTNVVEYSHVTYNQV